MVSIRVKATKVCTEHSNEVSNLPLLACLNASFTSTVRAPGTEDLPQNLPPPNLASFGHVAVSGAGELTVKLIDVTGEVLYQKVLSSTATDSPPSGSMHPYNLTVGVLVGLFVTLSSFA
jgi:hypothetical protein